RWVRRSCGAPVGVDADGGLCGGDAVLAEGGDRGGRDTGLGVFEGDARVVVAGVEVGVCLVGDGRNEGVEESSAGECFVDSFGGVRLGGEDVRDAVHALVRGGVDGAGDDIGEGFLFVVRCRVCDPGVGFGVDGVAVGFGGRERDCQFRVGFGPDDCGGVFVLACFVAVVGGGPVFGDRVSADAGVECGVDVVEDGLGLVGHQVSFGLWRPRCGAARLVTRCA